MKGAQIAVEDFAADLAAEDVLMRADDDVYSASYELREAALLRLLAMVVKVALR